MTGPVFARERTLNVAPNVLNDRFYVGYHDNGESGVRVPAWVANTLEGLSDAQILGYQTVDPKDVEQLDPGQHKPKNKDFGLRFALAKNKDGLVLGPGGMVLMWSHKGEIEARKKAEAARRLTKAPAPVNAPQEIPDDAFIETDVQSKVEDIPI